LKYTPYILMALISAATLLTAQISDTVYVRSYAVNVRTGPGLDFDKVTTVFINSPLRVMTRENDWLEVLVGDSLDGWVAQAYTQPAPVPRFDRDVIFYNDGGMRAKLRAVERMTPLHEGREFDFLKDVVINHHNYEFGPETDKILLSEIFNGWAQNSITEAIPILIYVIENDIQGEITADQGVCREIKLAAKEALKILVRKK